MEKKIQRMLCLGTVLLMMVIVAPCVSAKAESAEQVAGETVAQIVVPEAVVYSNVTHLAADGIVEGDGVRLRKKPSSSSTVLALMYNGEYVNILPYYSTANWHYVERIKTGVYGYVNKAYIYKF